MMTSKSRVLFASTNPFTRSFRSGIADSSGIAHQVSRTGRYIRGRGARARGVAVRSGGTMHDDRGPGRAGRAVGARKPALSGESAERSSVRPRTSGKPAGSLREREVTPKPPAERGQDVRVSLF